MGWNGRSSTNILVVIMVHVDWLTIVGRRQAQENDWTVHSAYITAAQDLDDRSSIFREAVGNPLEWEIVKPRAPYSFARRSADAARTLYVHPMTTHYTLELSGTHCQSIAEYIPRICADYAGQFARLDIAVDMETDTTPFEFDKLISAERVKTRSRLQSSTGQTVYVGSRTSERFARVYRYFEPHPRAKLLRAEFQLKGEYANGTASDIAQGITLDSLASGLGQIFGFTHGCWELRDTPKVVRVASHAQTGSTISWLCGTVAPLLKRLEREGKLDVKAWFEQYVTDV